MIRLLRGILLAAAVMLSIGLAGTATSAMAADAFKPGEIVVAPQAPNIAEYQVTGRTGETVPVIEILQEAADNDRFDMATFPRITIAGRTLTRAQVTSAGSDLNIVFESDRTTINLPGGGSATYGESEKYPFTPKIIVFPKAIDFNVSLSPESKTVKSGASVRFTATVHGTTGKLKYTWSFGDGSSDTETSGPSATHTFKGNDRTFPITVTVTETGNARNGTAAAVITIGKKAEKPKKPKKPDKEKSDPPVEDNNGDNYNGGNYGGGYGGSGTYGSGPANPMPASPATPEPKKKKKPDPIVDDGLVPVRGELLDPSIPGQIIDPSTEQPGGSEATGPEAKPKGFALSGGAKTALGIAALLGIGGLAEIGSFARFR